MSSGVRNLLIIVAIAAVLTFSQTAMGGAQVVQALLRLAILAGLAYVGYVLYREHRHRFAYLPARQRALLFGAIALLVVLVLGQPFVAGGLVGSIVVLALVGGCAYVIYRVWQDAQRYY